MKIDYRKFSRSSRLLILLTLSSCGHQQAPSDLKGSFQTKYVSSSFILFEDAGVSAIEAFVVRKAPHRAEAMSNRRLASLIEQVARGFSIDKRIFSSLVAQESAFIVAAQSSTHAVGLTQMTSIGIQEVNDQLGQRGATQARAAATAYFRGVIGSSICINCSDLWIRASDTAGMKRILLRDARTSLVYGAILLKSRLSAEKTKDSSLSLEEIYRNALRSYNGDPDISVREDYQTRIMNSAENQF